ncbi:CopG family transcriptional regulator [Streptomyces gamaensis]|uniref:CopG family transcriptional regulator n=1 Tax=Streptomyces gamaensis TaxID=1763542 RepID=A0ABW0Z5M4_9ACTN
MLKRTNVYADSEDLETIKEAAARLGVSEAEIIRRGVHIAALSVRTWDTPVFSDDELLDLGEAVTHDDIRSLRRTTGDTR